jgi:GT2 family glycosyltransferase
MTDACEPDCFAADAGAVALPPGDAAWLQGVPTEANDVEALYALCLGRAPDASPGLLRDACRRPLRDLALELACCDEIALNVLGALVQQRALPHEQLSEAVVRRVARWLQVQLHVPPGRPSAPALLAHFYAVPAVAHAMTLAHGALFAQAVRDLALLAAADGTAWQGKIEFVSREFVAGWLWDRSGHVARPALEIQCRGQVVGVATAYSFRADVAQRFGGDGLVGFRARWAPRQFAHGQPLELQLVVAGSQQPVGPAFHFANNFEDQLQVAQLLSKELEELKLRLDRLAAMVPPALGYAAFPLAHFDLYRRTHRVPPPQTPAAGRRRWIACIDTEGPDTLAADLRRSVDALREMAGTPHWRAVLVGQGGDAADVAALLSAADPRIGHVATWGDALVQAGADAGTWLLLLRAGERLDPMTLAWLERHADDPDAVLLYWDEDRLEHPHGRPPGRLPRHVQPVMRAPFDPDAMLEWNVVGDSFAVRADALHAAAQRLARADSASELLASSGEALAPGGRERLVWAMHAQGTLCHVPYFLLSDLRAATGPEAAGAERWVARQTPQALAPWLPPAWQGRAWSRVPDPIVRTGPKPLVRWAPCRPDSVISVLMPTRDHGDLVRQCVDSLRARALRPQALDIIVADNGSTDPATLRYLAQAERDGLIRVLPADEPFNWSRLNNRMAACSRGEHLLFLNNDTLMLTPEWDDILRGLLERDDEVGAVGARLLYEDMTIQHAGLLFGAEDFVAHQAVGQAVAAPTAFMNTQLTRRVRGVTGAFLACRRQTFDAVGPFDEAQLTVTFNDVQWCLRLTGGAQPKQIVYSPLLTMLHFESKSRGFDFLDPVKQQRADYERACLEAHWLERMRDEPDGHVALSRWGADALR